MEYLRDGRGALARVPRVELTQALASRLRGQQALAVLNSFRKEIERIVESIATHQEVNFESYTRNLEVQALKNVREQLLKRIQKGNTFLESGDYGLEVLIQELLTIEGYSAKILSKRATEGKADTDITAIKSDKFASTTLYVQAKHHQGFTGPVAITQLAELDVDPRAHKWIITTASMTK